MTIVYSTNDTPDPAEVTALLREGGFNRPLDDLQRVERMLRNADVIVTARDGGALVGIVRGLADYACYALVTELAVASSYKRLGIGRELLRSFREQVGDECAIILSSSVEGQAFYEHLGWDLLTRAWRPPPHQVSGASPFTFPPYSPAILARPSRRAVLERCPRRARRSSCGSNG